MRGRGAAVAALVGLLALAGLLGAGSAMGHAVLERTDPADGAVVAATPPRVALTFGEDVTLVPDAVRVYDAALHRVDDGAADHVAGDPRTAGVGLRPDLPPGTYGVTWRVVSADSHPVQGGFRFSIGHPGPTGAAPPSPGGTSGAVGVLLALARFAEYAGLAGLGGGLVLARLRTAGAPGRGPAHRPVLAGSWLLLGGSLAVLLLQGPDAQGLGPDAVADPDVLASTVTSPPGVLALLRIALLVVLVLVGAPLLRPVPDRASGHDAPGSRVRLAATLAVVLGLVLTVALGGHAAVGAWAVVGVVADVGHVVAMALWIGGLAVLAAAVGTRRPSAATATAVAAVLPGFSRLAQGCVAVVVATGLVATWREVGVPGALVATTYGWLLLAKVAVVVLVVLLGNRARVALLRADRPAVGALRRGLLLEAALAVVVLGVTSVLVATPQAAESYAPGLTDVQAANGLVLTARVDAAHTGTTTLHLSGTDPTGRATPLTLVHAAASLPAQGVGPLPLAGPPDALPVSFAVPGEWALDVTVAAPGTTPTLFRIRVPVR